MYEFSAGLFIVDGSLFSDAFKWLILYSVELRGDTSMMNAFVPLLLLLTNSYCFHEFKPTNSVVAGVWVVFHRPTELCAV
jgi:hypothetical protein